MPLILAILVFFFPVFIGLNIMSVENIDNFSRASIFMVVGISVVILSEHISRAELNLKQAQEELIRTEKLAAVGKLIGSIGHELRNPLSAISGSAYYLSMKIKDKDEKVMKHLNLLQREVQKSNNIISELLDYTRVKLPSFEEVDMNSIIIDTFDNFKFPENIVLERHLDANLPRIQIDPNLIQQAFQNIVFNAIQAMSDGGALKISTSIGEGMIWIAFEDTGVGITREILRKIFIPLFTTKKKGIGLGLSIVKEIIEKHGGKIEVESEINIGTTFIVKLPLIREKGV
ncbi:MAG: two-component system sensor histidine kinase NtrB [Promethearchaeota archaeon]